MSLSLCLVGTCPWTNVFEFAGVSFLSEPQLVEADGRPPEFGSAGGFFFPVNRTFLSLPSLPHDGGLHRSEDSVQKRFFMNCHLDSSWS